MMRTGALFATVISFAIIGLALDSEGVRLLIAGMLAMVAVPLWVSMRRSFQKQFWQGVEDIIVASGEQPPKPPPSGQG